MQLPDSRGERKHPISSRPALNHGVLCVSPIRLIRNAAFDPETTAVMGLAYEKATLDCTDDSVRELIATRIIEAARRGERDLDRLAEYGRQPPTT